MKNNTNKILIMVILTILALVVVVFVISRGSPSLVSPASREDKTQPSFHSLPQPAASSYNPPKEIKYDSSTDLQKELDSIKPQVLDSDFGT